MKHITFVLIILSFFIDVNAQNADTTKKNTDTISKEYHFSGTISATNNGISFIPTFSLGKPATIFNLSLGGKKLSFEPEMRFSLEGKPWSFLLWWRYKLINNNKFRITLGAHPGFSFKVIESSLNGASVSTINVQRYLAGELSPNYLLSKNTSIGMYYLFSHGIDYGTTKNTHFLTFNMNLSNIRLTNEYFAKITPQLYYLQMDSKSGYYATS